MKGRVFIIALVMILAISAVVIVNRSIQSALENPELNILSDDDTPSIPVEEGVFRRRWVANQYTNATFEGSDHRTLNNYYALRAYPGAPPRIPHPLVSEKGIGGNTCLQCHENGGFVTRFDAYAPVTPHPEMINCKQCHVPNTAAPVFTRTDFVKVDAPETGNAAYPGAPPVIPHGLQMRENCLACHAGPAAPVEIRVSHPERINCRQCHATGSAEQVINETVMVR